MYLTKKLKSMSLKQTQTAPTQTMILMPLMENSLVKREEISSQIYLVLLTHSVSNTMAILPTIK